MIETIQTPRLIVSTLRANTTLAQLGVRIYRDQAPATALMPYIVFRRYGGNDLDVIGGLQQGEFTRYTLRAVARIEHQADDELLEDIASAMQAALIAAAGTSYPSAVPLIHCDGFYREAAIDLSYPASDNPRAQIRELGGIYAAYVQAL